MRARFFPGDVLLTLASRANDLTGTDLLLVDRTAVPIPPAELSHHWRRMLHERSLIACHGPAGSAGRLALIGPADLPDGDVGQSRRPLAA
jgi:hypothetical protein